MGFQKNVIAANEGNCTALATGLNVYKYITYVLEKRPTEEMADSELEKLLPWNDKVFEMCKIERQIKTKNNLS